MFKYTLSDCNIPVISLPMLNLQLIQIYALNAINIDVIVILKEKGYRKLQNFGKKVTVKSETH